MIDMSAYDVVLRWFGFGFGLALALWGATLLVRGVWFEDAARAQRAALSGNLSIVGAFAQTLWWMFLHQGFPAFMMALGVMVAITYRPLI